MKVKAQLDHWNNAVMTEADIVLTALIAKVVDGAAKKFQRRDTAKETIMLVKVHHNRKTELPNETAARLKGIQEFRG